MRTIRKPAQRATLALPSRWPTAALVLGLPGMARLHQLIRSRRNGSGSLRFIRFRMLRQEFLLVLGGVLLYFGGRGLTQSDPGPAQQHAQHLVSFEKALGIYWEPALQAVIDGSHTLVTTANSIYIYGHWPMIALTLAWLLLRHPGRYRRTRNAMAISGAIGMVIFVLYPVAPPRLAELGLLDTVTQHSDAYRVLQPPAFTNIYAAMPSLHVGWDLLMGIAIATTARHRSIRLFGFLLPALMAVAVVVTANHYVVDVVAGASIALVGLAVARRMETAAGSPKDQTSPANQAGIPTPIGTASQIDDERHELHVA